MDHKDVAALEMAANKNMPLALTQAVQFHKDETKPWLEMYYQSKLPDTDMSWVIGATQCVAKVNFNVRCRNPAVGIGRVCADCQTWESPEKPLYTWACTTRN